MQNTGLLLLRSEDGQKQSNKMAELDSPNFHFFTSFSFDFLKDDELFSGTKYVSE